MESETGPFYEDQNLTVRSATELPLDKVKPNSPEDLTVSVEGLCLRLVVLSIQDFPPSFYYSFKLVSAHAFLLMSDTCLFICILRKYTSLPRAYQLETDLKLLTFQAPLDIMTMYIYKRYIYMSNVPFFIKTKMCSLPCVKEGFLRALGLRWINYSQTYWNTDLYCEKKAIPSLETSWTLPWP